MPSPDLDELDLTLRDLPGVVHVGAEWIGDGLRLTLVVVDPLRRDAIESEARALAAAYLDDDGPVHVEVQARGAPLARLAVQDVLASLHGVIDCQVERGARGEVERMNVVVDSAVAAEAVAEVVAAEVGPGFAQRRLAIETRI